MRPLLLSLLFVTACVDADAPVHPGDDSVVEITVPEGASGRSLTPLLIEQGLVPGEWSWRWVLRSSDASCIKDATGCPSWVIKRSVPAPTSRFSGRSVGFAV